MSGKGQQISTIIKPRLGKQLLINVNSIKFDGDERRIQSQNKQW